MHAFSDLVAQFETRFQAAVPTTARPATLYDPIRYFLALGGKRVRPVLCLMACELFGGLTEDAWHAAMAVELFHNFTLVHDDIMDRAPLRRGKQTVHEKYGLTSGILGGDALCILAYDHLAKIRQPLQPVLQAFNRMALDVCEGQQFDMDFEGRQVVAVPEYVEMIALKTSVLLACSLKMGALLGGASPSAAEKLYQFGKAVGLAFQLQDDYLDAFGDPEKTGKQPGGDILANKKTYLFLKALEGADEAQRTALAAHFSSTDDAGKVQAVQAIFESTGARDECRKAVESYSAQAFQCLNEAAVLDSRKEPLRQLAAYLLQRDS